MPCLSKPLPTLTNMPYEVMVNIISNSDCTRADWANFRLVCLAMEQPGASFLFRWVKMSRLKKDWDAFKEIASREHLSKHVRQIVWHELNIDSWTHTPRDLDPSSKKPKDKKGNEVNPFSRSEQLMKDALEDEDMFWLPKTTPTFNDRMPIYDHIVGTFISGFAMGVKDMPNLKSVRSVPMPKNRVFYYRGIPLRASLYRFQDTPVRNISNDGFFKFLLPIMSQPESKIVSLHWADEPAAITTYSFNLISHHVSAFESLTSIDLCICQSMQASQAGPDGLIACLGAAAKLRQLSLCFERTSVPFVLTNLIFEKCHWPELRSLKLMNASLPDGAYDFLCRNHSPALKYITLIMCNVKVSEFVAMRNASTVELQSIRIVTIPSRDLRMVSQQNLVEAFNTKSTRCLTVDGNDIELDTDEGELATGELATGVSDCDRHAWCMAGYYDPDIRDLEHECSDIERKVIEDDVYIPGDTDSDYDESYDTDDEIMEELINVIDMNAQ
ncbi:hypothetical protein F4804DRAFT_351271 [Jackrogersella minutella]|nr:hypothetical protein F4804DRAFT_351271 [Jackrogersella minutella]